jgi:hypothetical protein
MEKSQKFFTELPFLTFPSLPILRRIHNQAQVFIW